MVAPPPVGSLRWEDRAREEKGSLNSINIQWVESGGCVQKNEFWVEKRRKEGE